MDRDDSVRWLPGGEIDRALEEFEAGSPTFLSIAPLYGTTADGASVEVACFLRMHSDPWFEEIQELSSRGEQIDFDARWSVLRPADGSSAIPACAKFNVEFRTPRKLSLCTRVPIEAPEVAEALRVAARTQTVSLIAGEPVKGDHHHAVVLHPVPAEPLGFLLR
jgi:hypothetical protein